MAHAFTLTEERASAISLAAPTGAAADPAGLHRLPEEWQAVERVVLEDAVIDHVVVGPNGVFAVALDPDPGPVTLGPDGLYREGQRLTTTVKGALAAAFSLRERVGPQLFAYPLLVTPLDGSAANLDRLGVIPPGGIPEAIWSHPGVPLTRTQRLETLWSLRSLAS